MGRYESEAMRKWSYAYRVVRMVGAYDRVHIERFVWKVEVCVR